MKKYNEVASMQRHELKDELEKSLKELHELRLGNELKQLKETHKIRSTKRYISQLKTALHTYPSEEPSEHKELPAPAEKTGNAKEPSKARKSIKNVTEPRTKKPTKTVAKKKIAGK